MNTNNQYARGMGYCVGDGYVKPIVKVFKHGVRGYCPLCNLRVRMRARVNRSHKREGDSKPR